MANDIRTLHIRIKDRHAASLRRMAREVNTTWNFCNETSAKAIRDRRQFLSGHDLQKLTDGFSKCEGVQIGSATTQQVCEEYATRRKQFKKVKLRWRVSNPNSSRYSLGWVPFKARAVRYKAGQVTFAGQKFGLWDSYGLANFELRAGSFSEDSRGRWFLNVAVAMPEFVGPMLPVTASVAIDLGLKNAATSSCGAKIDGRYYRKLQAKLGLAQRAGKKDRARAIHQKIKNQRKDEQHKFSTSRVKENAAIFVGDVSSAKLVKSRMATSTYDAGWSSLKTMFEYKSRRAGRVFEEINEAYTTQTCSCCGKIPASSPKGRVGLRIREWTCSECGAVHDRDINAARNILALGHQRLAGGSPNAAAHKGCRTRVGLVP